MAGRMERVISRSLLFLISICIMFHVNFSAIVAEEILIPRLSVTDYIPFDSGLSFLRYGSFGEGIFPYLPSLPGAAVEIRVDGVPLPSYSPFGANLERIPCLAIDSLAVVQRRAIWMATPDSIPKMPLTRMDFFTGDKRRFGFQTTFLRRLTANSGIFASGASNGIHGGDVTEGNTSRDYYFKFLHNLKNGSLMQAAISGGLYRTDISDIVTHHTMGSSAMDNLLLSLGVKNYRISHDTALFSSVYYRGGLSQVKRFNVPANFDDDAFGGIISLATEKPGKTYNLDFSVDSRRFKGRTVRAVFRDTVSRILASGSWNLKPVRASASGGVAYSSRYGAGGNADGFLSMPFYGKSELEAHGYLSHEFPNPGNEFYPSLTFSDTILSSGLKRYHISGIEAGIKFKKWGGDWGVYQFGSFANTPFFVPLTPSERLSGTERYTGTRLTLSVRREGKVRYEGNAKVDFNGSSTPRLVWPHPFLDGIAKANASRIFFGGAMHGAFFSEAELLRWKHGPITPDGVFFLLDCGISARIGSFSIFYKMENLTNQDIHWFDTLGWQGMNSLWGVNWELRN
jgi:hypothetical protein